MNHLAHAYLGNLLHDEAIVGNFIADYARGAVQNLHYTDKIKVGITMHRAIDSFTDSHEAIHEACLLLHATQHHYSPIVIDVCFDYFLANSPIIFSPTNSLHDFSLHVCNALKTHKNILPSPLKERIDGMIKHNFLVHYEKYEGLQFAFESIAKRTRFDNHLLGALEDFKANEGKLKLIFEQFFPELQEYISNMSY